MEQIRNYGDDRQLTWCVYCGGAIETRDHIPSKVLLDDPLPENLPVVPACLACNSGFAPDEDYFACLIECVLAGSTDLEKLTRAKVKRILARAPALAKRIEAARKEQADDIIFAVEHERVKTVVLKHARGHAAFDLNEPQHSDPTAVAIRPLGLMSSTERAAFEIPGTGLIAPWPEVGSRMMQRLVEGRIEAGGWIVVQRGRYRYAASVDAGVSIRLVFSEYLGCEVAWD
jgi:hypothetical protein